MEDRFESDRFESERYTIKSNVILDRGAARMELSREETGVGAERVKGSGGRREEKKSAGGTSSGRVNCRGDRGTGNGIFVIGGESRIQWWERRLQNHNLYNLTTERRLSRTEAICCKV